MTDDLNKIVADLMEMRKGEAQGIMMMANSDDTMFEDCISRLKALAAHRPEVEPTGVGAAYEQAIRESVGSILSKHAAELILNRAVAILLAPSPQKDTK